MNRANLKEKISEISNSEFPLIDFFNDIGWLEGSKWFNTEKAYEDIEKIYNVFVYYTNKNKQLEKENQGLKKVRDNYSDQLNYVWNIVNSLKDENTRLKQAIKILKEKVEMPLIDDFEVINKDYIHLYRLRTKALINEEEYELLKEVFESVGGSDE